LILRELALRDMGELPAWARATALRWFGELDGASRALAEVEPASLADGELTVVVGEWIVRGELDTARRALEGRQTWLAWALLARAEGDATAEAAMWRSVLRVTPESAMRHHSVLALLENRRDLTRWYHLAPAGPRDALVERWRNLAPAETTAWLAEAQATRPDGANIADRLAPRVPPGCAADAARLHELRAALIAHRLEEADRLARDYVDGDMAAACRAHDVADGFAAAGEVTRAVAFLDELLLENPMDAEASTRIAEVLAATDPARAWIALNQAEYWGVRGEASLRAAQAFRRAQQPIEAIAAARQALQLASGGVRWRAYEELVFAARAAGRPEDSARAAAAYLDAVPSRLRTFASARLAAPVTPALDEQAEAELLLDALLDDGARGKAALETLALIAERRGDASRAADLRTELRWLP
jgi:hypothetical protein